MCPPGNGWYETGCPDFTNPFTVQLAGRRTSDKGGASFMVASVTVFCLQGWTLAVAAQWTAPSTENASSICLCLRCVAAVLQKGA